MKKELTAYLDRTRFEFMTNETDRRAALQGAADFYSQLIYFIAEDPYTRLGPISVTPEIAAHVYQARSHLDQGYLGNFEMHALDYKNNQPYPYYASVTPEKPYADSAGVFWNFNRRMPYLLSTIIQKTGCRVFMQYLTLPQKPSSPYEVRSFIGLTNDKVEITLPGANIIDWTIPLDKSTRPEQITYRYAWIAQLPCNNVDEGVHVYVELPNTQRKKGKPRRVNQRVTVPATSSVSM